MTRKGKKSRESIAKLLDVPENIYEAFAQIVLCGNREAILDGCQGVVEYEDNYIKLKIGRQIVRFTGNKLQIKCMTDDNVIIEGIIKSVDFEE